MMKRYLLIFLLFHSFLQVHAASFTMSPMIGVRDTTMVITINGVGTHFTAPVNYINFNYLYGNVASDITIDSTWVESNTLMYIRITIEPDARLEYYMFTIYNTQDYLQLPNSFSVQGAGINIPAKQFIRGTGNYINLTAINTSFANDSLLGVEIYDNSTGALVTNITVDSGSIFNADTIKCKLTVNYEAKWAKYKLFLYTKKNGLLKSAFVILPPVINAPIFARIMAKKSWVLDVIGSYTLFKAGAPDSCVAYRNDTLDDNFHIDSCVAISNTEMKIYTRLANDIVPGFYDLKIWNTYDKDVMLRVTVDEYVPPKIQYVSPLLYRDTQMVVSVRSIHTHFDKGTNTIQFLKNDTESAQIKIDSIQVIDAENMDIYVSIDAMARAGKYTIRINNTFDDVPVEFIINVQKGLLQTDPSFYNAYSGTQSNVFIKTNGNSLFTHSNDAVVWLQENILFSGRNTVIPLDSFHVINDTLINIWFSPPKHTSGKYFQVRYYSLLDDSLDGIYFTQILAPELIDTQVTMSRMEDTITMTFKGKRTHFFNTDTILFGYYDNLWDQVYFEDSIFRYSDLNIISDTLIQFKVISINPDPNFRYHVFIRDSVYGYIHSELTNINIGVPAIKSISPESIWRYPVDSILLTTQYFIDPASEIDSFYFTSQSSYNPYIRVVNYTVHDRNHLTLRLSVKEPFPYHSDDILWIQLTDGKLLRQEIQIKRPILVDFYPKTFYRGVTQTFNFITKGVSPQSGLRLWVFPNGPGDTSYLKIHSISYSKPDTIVMIATPSDSFIYYNTYFFYIYESSNELFASGKLNDFYTGVNEEQNRQRYHYTVNNPVQGDLHFFKQGDFLISSIRIIDLQGKQVFTKSFSKTDTQNDIVIADQELKNLSGLFFIETEINGTKQYIKIMIE